MHALSLLAAVIVALPLAEVAFRVKNRAMDNHQMEMWRYSRELKRSSKNPILGHEHIPSTSAVLQGVEIRLNEWGMRGKPVPPKSPDRRRILLLGSSITLGWGVPEDQTMPARLQELFTRNGIEAEVLNAGIGNYNAVRYIEMFLTKLYELEPTDVVVHYFINDAEVLEPGGGNVLIQHSQLAAQLWSLHQQHAAGTGERGLIDHYTRVYRPDAPGFVAMKDALKRLAEYASAHGIRLYLAVTPDIHNLTDYPFHFAHEAMSAVVAELEFAFVDLYPGFAGLTREQVWSIPGDPHPNGLGHETMALTLYPVLLASAEPGQVAMHTAP